MTRSRSTSRRWWAPASIGVIAAVMVAVVVFGDNSSTTPPEEETAVSENVDGVNNAPETNQPQEATRIDVARRDADDPLAVGEVDAPVALVMISDFQCGYCALWSTQTLPAMLEFVESGDLRIEWRDIAFFGEPSLRAALAAYAAGEQGEYLAFSRALFDTGSAPDAALLSDEGLEALAGELGLDVDQFNSDRGGENAASGVQMNIDEATGLGASSTPSFLLNGRPIVGAQPTDVFIDAMNKELSQTS